MIVVLIRQLFRWPMSRKNGHVTELKVTNSEHNVQELT